MSSLLRPCTANIDFNLCSNGNNRGNKNCPQGSTYELNKLSKQCSGSLKIDNPEAMLHQLFINSNSFDNDDEFNGFDMGKKQNQHIQPCYLQLGSSTDGFPQSNLIQNTKKLSVRDLFSNNLLQHQNQQQDQSDEEQIVKISKQLGQNQQLMIGLMVQLQKQGENTVLLMQQMANNLQTLSYYQKICHYFSQQNKEIDTKIQSFSTNTNQKCHEKLHDFLNNQGLQIKRRKIFENRANNRAQAQQNLNSLQKSPINFSNKYSQLLNKNSMIPKQEQRLSLKIANQIKEHKNKSLQKYQKNGYQGKIKQKQNYNLANETQQQLMAIEQMNRNQQCVERDRVSSFDSQNNVWNYGSINKSLSTTESIDQLFSNINIANSTPSQFPQGQEGKKMYKKIMPSSTWGTEPRQTVHYAWAHKNTNNKVQNKQNQKIGRQNNTTNLNIIEGARNRVSEQMMCLNQLKKNGSIGNKYGCGSTSNGLNSNKSSARGRVSAIKIDVRATYK